MEDFANRVRRAQDAAARKRQAQLAADDKKRAEQAAAEDEITKAGSLLARALRDQGVPTDIAVDHLESQIRKKLFGGAVRDDVTHHVLHGWVFGETRHTFRDPDSRFSKTETSLRGYILAKDGGVHCCNVGQIQVSANGQITVLVRDSWGSTIHNGPLGAVMMSMCRDTILEGMVQLAVKHQIDPASLPPSG